MSKTITENNLLNIEKKVETMKDGSCLLSLNLVALSLSVDAYRTAKYFKQRLEQWQSCLPLGEAGDVNFAGWSSRIRHFILDIRSAYNIYKVQQNPHDDDRDSFPVLKERLQSINIYDGSMQIFSEIDGKDVPGIVVCALRELSDILLEINEFLNSPTEEMIAVSYEKWQSEYRKHYLRKFRKDYNNWKIQYSTRMLKKNLVKRRKEELDKFRTLFVSDDEFEQVFDVEQQNIDNDGLSRFLFTHSERFGESYMGARPMLSKEVVSLFDFVEFWQQIKADFQPVKKRTEKSAEKAAEEDSLMTQIDKVVERVEHLTTEKWEGRIVHLWHGIVKTFHQEIATAGPHEKFRDFSKKTVYSIIGHLKQCGVYRSNVANAEVTRLLEDGKNTGMRKYVNNGLEELDTDLRDKLRAHIADQMLILTA